MLWTGGGGGGASITPNSCDPGDFATGIDGTGTLTCDTPSGSGDVTAVGDCTSGDCFTGSDGTTLTGLADTTLQIQSQRSVYVNVDSDNNATSHGFFVGYNGTGTSTTRLFIVQEAGQTELRNGTDLRLYETDDSNYVEVAAPTLSGNYTLTLPTTDGATNDLLYNTDGSGTLGWRTPNAGTDITADLEEETHASEHSLGGTDPITVTNLASGCTDGQVLGGTAGGTGVECQADVDTNTNASTICAGTTTYLDGEGNCDDISTVYQAADADLTAVAGLSGTGLVARTASNTFTTRSVAEGLAIDVTNGDGVSGNPTVALDPSEFTGAQVWGDGTGTMSWTFNTGGVDTIIDFQAADGVMDITGGLEVNNVPVLTDGTGTVDATNLATDSVSADELNATGVESELEAVLDLNQLQGQIADGQIADGAVDGGSGGEIADGSVTADDLGADSVSASELNATGVESELEAVLDLQDLQGAVTDAQVPNSITIDTAATATNNTLLAGRAGTGNDTTLSTDATGTLYGSNDSSGSSLTLRATSANTTSGEIDLNAPTVELYPSFPATSITAQTLLKATPTSTLDQTTGTNYTTVDSSPVFSAADITGISHFRAGGSLARTGTTGATLYSAVGFLSDTNFTSATSGGPLFQDAFYDASTITQTAGTATQSTWVPISFLSRPTLAASGTASLTVAKMYGAQFDPVFNEGGSATLALTDYAALSVADPAPTGSPAITNYMALRIEDLSDATVTNPISVLSEGTTTTMRHAGPARFGATGAPTANFDLDVQGAAKVADYMDIGDDIADLTTNTVKVLDIGDTVNMSGNGELNGLYFGLTHTNSAGFAGALYGINVVPTLSSNSIDTFSGLRVAGTVTQTAKVSTLYSGAAYIMNHGTTYSSSTAGVHPREGVFAIYNLPTITMSATSSSATQTNNIAVVHNPTVSNTGAGGTFTLTNDYGLRMTGTYTETAGTLNVTNRIGLSYADVTNTSSATSITNNIGVDIAALSTATNNIGIRNADTTVNTPTTQAITANSDTIQPAATTVCLTANSNYDLTSNPQIADGVEGQILYLWNCDTSTETVEINDTNGLQLTALFNMDAGDVIVLQYMNIAGAADWYEVSRVED